MTQTPQLHPGTKQEPLSGEALMTYLKAVNLIHIDAIDSVGEKAAERAAKAAEMMSELHAAPEDMEEYKALYDAAVMTGVARQMDWQSLRTLALAGEHADFDDLNDALLLAHAYSRGGDEEKLDALLEETLTALENMPVVTDNDCDFQEMLARWWEIGISLELTIADMPDNRYGDDLRPLIRFLEVQRKHVSAHIRANARITKFWHELALTTMYKVAGDQDHATVHCRQVADTLKKCSPLERKTLCPSLWLRYARLAAKFDDKGLCSLIGHLMAVSPNGSVALMPMPDEHAAQGHA